MMVGRPMRRGILWLLVGALLLLASGAEVRAQEGKSGERQVQLTVLHVNDLHGQVDPTLDPASPSADKRLGGIAYLASLIARERAQNPQATLLLNGGDLAEGSMLSYLSRGVAYCRALEALKFDALTLGNHDLAWGQEALKGMLEALQSPVVSANLVRLSSGTPFPYTAPYRLVEAGGVKVGILGLETPDLAHFIASSKLRDLSVRAAQETVAWYLPLLRQAGAQVIIILSHIGYENDLALAESLAGEGIALIVGAHSHTLLPQGERVGETLIVQAGYASKYLGRVDLDLREEAGGWKVHSAKAKLLPVVCSQLEPDPKVEEILAPYRKEAKRLGDEIWGHAQEDILFAHREAAKLNQIHADSILEAARNLRRQQEGFDPPGEEAPLFGICNSRTLRANLPRGPIHYRDLYAALPFTEENYVTMRVKGSMVLAEIEDDLRDKATELAVPCGLSYKYDPSRPQGQRVVEIKLADGQPLDLEREYVIVTNETMSRKPAFAAAQDKRVLGPVQPLFFQKVRQLSPLDNRADARVVKI